MSEKRFQKTRIVDKWGGIYDSETDRVLDVNDVEHKLNEQQATITKLKELNDDKGKKIISLIRTNKTLKEENEQLRMKLKGDDYIMVSEMLSNLRKTGICDGCKNKDKPVEWYLERGFSITGQICDRYEPEV